MENTFHLLCLLEAIFGVQVDSLVNAKAYVRWRALPIGLPSCKFTENADKMAENENITAITSQKMIA